MNDELDARQHPRFRWSRMIAPALTLALVMLVLALATVQSHGWDGSTNADGVSYLDLAARYSRGEWGAMANGYWSPLYPMLLGGAWHAAAWIPDGSRRELAIAFAVNIVIFGVAALSFARLTRLLTLPLTPARSPLVLACRIVAAAAICVWSLIRLVGATTITPDALLAALLLLVAAELVAVGSQPPSTARDLRFGALLAAGYWTKAVFFPVAIVAVAAYAIAGGRAARRHAVPRVLLALVILAAPLVAMQSYSQGRPSFGETGRLNYRWYVLNAEHAPRTTEPEDSTRLRTRPAAVALTSVTDGVLYTGDVPGSFPYWYDPSRYEPQGVGPLSLDAQLVIFGFNFHWLRAAAGLLFGIGGVALAAAALRGRARWSRLYALVPALTTLMLYLLTHPEGRMGAASLACVVLSMITLVDVGAATHRRWLAAIECVALLALAAVAVGRSTNRIPVQSTAALDASGELSRQLRAAGLRPGDRVGVVGDGYGLRWAHETGTRIVATVPMSTYKARVTDSTLMAATREVAARGYPLKAFLYPLSADVQSSRAVRVADDWFVWKAR